MLHGALHGRAAHYPAEVADPPAVPERFAIAAGRLARRLRALLPVALVGLGLCAPASQAASAQAVLLNLGAGMHGRAQYYAGRADRPAVLFVHDFLATPGAPMVDAMARRLARDRVDLLVPTLSLDIVARSTPLPCEAVHTHFFEQDLRELRQWVEWLVAKGRTRIVLVGMRYGGWQALVLTRGLLSTAVQAVIMISPQQPPEHGLDLAPLRAAAAGGARELMHHPVWHCARYVGPADSVYSYARWDAPRLLRAVNGADVAVRAIVGGRDRGLDAGWRERLDDAGALVQLVPEASGFRDPRHLDALLELIVASLIIEG